MQTFRKAGKNSSDWAYIKKKKQVLDGIPKHDRSATEKMKILGLTSIYYKTLVSQTKSEFQQTRVMYEAKLVAGEGTEETPEAPFCIEISRFSSVTKLLRVTALAARIIGKLKKQKSSNSPIEASEINGTEQKWIRYRQTEHFSEMIMSIKKNKTSNYKD